jgi:hypothetical protein
LQIYAFFLKHTQFICKKFEKKLPLQFSVIQILAKYIDNFAKNLFFNKQKKLNLKFDWNVIIVLIVAADKQKRQQI